MMFLSIGPFFDADFSALPPGIAVAALTSATRVQFILLTSQRFFATGSKFSRDVSPAFATAAGADASAIIALDSQKHVAHHLSLLTRGWKLASVVIELCRRKKEGTPESASPVLLTSGLLAARSRAAASAATATPALAARTITTAAVTT